MKMYVDRNLGLLNIKRKFLASLLLSHKVAQNMSQNMRYH